MLDTTAAAVLKRQTDNLRAADINPPDRLSLEVAADKSPDIDVRGRGSEALQQGIAPRQRTGRAA